MEPLHLGWLLLQRAHDTRFADLHKDLAVVGEADHAWFLGTVFSAGLLVLIVAAALAG